MNLSGSTNTDLNFDPDEVKSDSVEKLKTSQEGLKTLVEAIVITDAANHYATVTNQCHDDSTTNSSKEGAESKS